MPYSLKYNINKDFLEVYIKGQRVPGKVVEEGVSRWSEIAKLCEKERLNRILAIMNISGKFRVDDAFRLVESADIVGWRKDFKLGVVAVTHELYMELMFSETTMVNLGYEMKLFDNKRTAKKWLLS